MMRMLRALISSMLRSIVDLLKVPTMRGMPLVASISAGSRPRSTASENCEDRSPSSSRRFSARRSM